MSKQQKNKEPLLNQQLYITPNFPFRITILTLISYALGLALIIDWRVSLTLIVGFIIMTYFISSKSIFYQSFEELLSFIITTYIFGLIHAYTFQQICVFIFQPKQQQLKQVWPLFQIYLSFMVVYYYFQFQLNNCFHHQLLCWNQSIAFLIYHSKPYLMANVFSLTEHVIGKYLIQFEYKNYHYLIYPALIFMILGQGLRITAFFTAKSNFTHLVRYKKHPQHQLITHGVYSFFRHPSYTGYFYFSISSQLFIGNWISAIGFFITLIGFFKDRIWDEEVMLASFFEKYLYYRKKTHILIPFVKGPTSQEIMKQIIRDPTKRS